MLISLNLKSINNYIFGFSYCYFYQFLGFLAGINQNGTELFVNKLVKSCAMLHISNKVGLVLYNPLLFIK